MTASKKAVRRIGIALCELFTLGTILMLLITGQYDRLPLAFGTLLLVLLPSAMEQLLHCRICLPVYLFALLYAVGPMLGQCWNLYYTVACWDKILHICGGVMFAIVGLYLFDFLNRGQKSMLLCVTFALCFSMALGAAWEFVEFGSDQLLHSDMQDDTVITSLYSYMLDDGIGVAGSIPDIQSVVIDGTPLPVDGYIDIGLIDTMLDMLLETLGALAICVAALIDKGNHPLIEKLPTNKEN